MNNTAQLKKDQVYQQLLESITSGELAVGNKLPRETDMSTKLGISRVTMRAALNRLRKEGFIESIQGSGTFVASQTAKTKSNGTIMVVHNADSGFQSTWHYIVPEISRFANERQFRTFVTTNEAFEMFSDDNIKTFAAKNNITGVISTINHFNGAEIVIDKLCALNVPVLLAHSGMNDYKATGFASIAVNEKNGWKAAIKHLAEQGHQNIAIIGNNGSSKNSFRNNDKADTLKQLADCGANPNPELITQTGFDKLEIANAVKTLLKGSSKPTAFLCYSDFYAIYVYEILEILQLRIPEDIAVMGICGFPDAKFLSPPLSTIDYEYAELGKMAVEMIIEPKKWFDAKTGKGKLRVKPFQLRARKSTKQSKEVTIDKAYHTSQVENVVFA